MSALGSAQLLAFPGPGIGLRTALTAQLKRHRLPEHLIEAFIREAGLLPVCGIDEALTGVLKARMRATPLDLSRTPRLFLIGPSGAGVSSAAAKLRHHAAGRDQAITVETSSFNPRNLKARTAFGCMNQREGVETIGVISALADAEEISDIISAFRLTRIIVTGLDMARRFGALAAAVTQGARLAHVTRSPNQDAALETLTPRALADMLLG
jgi:hypothetical protein